MRSSYSTKLSIFSIVNVLLFPILGIGITMCNNLKFLLCSFIEHIAMCVLAITVSSFVNLDLLANL